MQNGDGAVENKTGTGSSIGFLRYIV